MGGNKAHFPRNMPVSLRVMPGVRAALDKDAEKKGMSINTIIASLLEKHYLGETYEEKMAKMFK